MSAPQTSKQAQVKGVQAGFEMQTVADDQHTGLQVKVPYRWTAINSCTGPVAHSWILAPSASSNVMSMKKLAVLSGGKRACTAEMQDFSDLPGNSKCCQLPALDRQLFPCYSREASKPVQHIQRKTQARGLPGVKGTVPGGAHRGVNMHYCSCQFLMQDVALSGSACQHSTAGGAGSLGTKSGT